MKGRSLHTRSFRRIHFSVVRYRWCKLNGFTGPKSFRGFWETANVIWKRIQFIQYGVMSQFQGFLQVTTILFKPHFWWILISVFFLWTSHRNEISRYFATIRDLVLSQSLALWVYICCLVSFHCWKCVNPKVLTSVVFAVLGSPEFNSPTASVGILNSLLYLYFFLFTVVSISARVLNTFDT